MRLKMDKLRKTSIKPKADFWKGLIKLVNLKQDWQRKREYTNYQYQEIKKEYDHRHRGYLKQ